MKRFIKWFSLTVLAIIIVVAIAFQLSPYPSVWIIRSAFDKEAVRVNEALAPHVPANIATVSNLQYDEKDPTALLDAYYPADAATANLKLPVIVWTHGGGLVSGKKEHISNYCKILAAKGYLALSIDYTIAPEAKYPTPVRQLNKALSFIATGSHALPADTSFIVLAGDSGGSYISAVAACVITNPSYAALTGVQPGLQASQLKGLLLYCGIYNIEQINTEGDFGSFLNTVMWAYFGTKDQASNPHTRTASVTNFLTPSFPPTFISAGNADPLLPQSKILSSRLIATGVAVDTLFFADHQQPALLHEYQFHMDAAGKLALERSVSFLQRLANQRNLSQQVTTSVN